MASEYHNGWRGSHLVLASGALSSNLRRRAVAALALAALVGARLVAPPAVTASVPGRWTDPRFLAVERKGCGSASSVASPAATVPATGSGSLGRPPWWKPGTTRFVAFQQPPPSPTPATSPSPGTSAPPDTGGSPVPPGATGQPGTGAPPTPTASPSLIPIPPALRGPAELIPPTPQQSTTPTPVPIPTTPPPAGASGPVYLVRPSGPPSIGPRGGSASPTPAAVPTLGPYQIATISDRLSGNTGPGQPADLDGNVHVYYIEGQIVGDHAHYDGEHTMTISGHTYLINRVQDAILYADSIVFDTLTHKATLINGRGETTEGVATGKFHYTAQQLTTNDAGVSHGDHASFTTCENPHGGYHVESRTLDVFPGDKLVARKAVVFLGPLAIFYLPLLVIPLRDVPNQQRTSSFIPLIGYDQLEGFYVKARIDFAPSNTYYGYYRIDYYTKRGLGLGYTAFIGSQTNRRYVTIDTYTIDDHIQEARQTNVNLEEVENFSNRLRSQIGVQYQGDFGAGLSLPPNLTINGSLTHQGVASTEDLTFSRTTQGSLADQLTLAFLDSLTLSQVLNQQINLSYSKYDSPGALSDTLHINTLTHFFTKFADFNLEYDKTDFSSLGFGYDSVPQLQIVPHINFGNSRFPFQTDLTIGQYTEPQNHFSTERVQFDFNQPVAFKIFNTSDFTANLNLTQDYYGTGDAKGYIQQNAALNTPLGDHIVNSVTYNEANPLGPPDVPFQLLDRLSGGTHSAQDTIRFFNGDVYSFSLSDSTYFNRQAQPVTYQLNYRPSLRSLLSVGGVWNPGVGNGFYQSNVQVLTPFGRDTTLSFATNVDWKMKGALIDKNIFLTHTVGNCYTLNLSYNQDLKAFNFFVNLLAFPGQGVGGGFGQGSTGSGIIPQGFTL